MRLRERNPTSIGSTRVFRNLRNFAASILLALVVLAVTMATDPAPLGAFDGEAASVGHGAAPPPQNGGDAEANLPYLFAVYIITWAAFFAYVFYLSRRQRDMRSEIEALKRALAQREAAENADSQPESEV